MFVFGQWSGPHMQWLTWLAASETGMWLLRLWHSFLVSLLSWPHVSIQLCLPSVTPSMSISNFTLAFLLVIERWSRCKRLFGILYPAHSTPPCIPPTMHQTHLQIHTTSVIANFKMDWSFCASKHHSGGSKTSYKLLCQLSKSQKLSHANISIKHKTTISSEKAAI